MTEQVLKTRQAFELKIHDLHEDIVLHPLCLCETRKGDMAHAVGRVAFQTGKPMLVEHVGGLYLLHDLKGRVLSNGYGPEYDVVHIF